MDNVELFDGGLRFPILSKITKEDLKSQVSVYVNQIIDGHVDALDVLIMSKKIQQLGEELESKVRPIAEEKSTIGRGVYSRFSTDVTEKVVGAKTDYTYCGDPEWESMQETLSDLKVAIKQRESFLSGISSPTTIVTKDGEIVTINPPVKSGRLGLSITLK